MAEGAIWNRECMQTAAALASASACVLRKVGGAQGGTAPAGSTGAVPAPLGFPAQTVQRAKTLQGLQMKGT
jgi:hypothetical protein